MKKVMKIIDEENNCGEYEIFCTFDSDMTNKSYVIYTKYSEEKDGTLIMNAGSYVEESDCLRVDKKLTHEENEMVSSVMENLIQQAEKLSD